MPVHRRALRDLSDVPVTPIQEADIEQDSATPSSSLSKPLLDHEAGLGLHGELPACNGPHGQAPEGLDPSQEDKARFITTILINLSAIMERTDEQLLPAVYRFVGASFQVCHPARAHSAPAPQSYGLDTWPHLMLDAQCSCCWPQQESLMALLMCGAIPVQASPSELGLLTLSRAVVQALVSPVGGFLGEA